VPVRKKMNRTLDFAIGNGLEVVQT
jgi:hypothetical protein